MWERDRERRVAKPGGDNALLHIQFITAHEYATDVDMTTDHREGPGLSSQLFNYVPTLHVHILPAKWAAAWQDRAERSNDCMRHAAQHLSEKLCTFYSLIRSLSLFFFSPRSFLDRHLVTIDIERGAKLSHSSIHFLYFFSFHGIQWIFISDSSTLLENEPHKLQVNWILAWQNCSMIVGFDFDVIYDCRVFLALSLLIAISSISWCSLMPC